MKCPHIVFAYFAVTILPRLYDEANERESRVCREILCEVRERLDVCIWNRVTLVLLRLIVKDGT